jgi:hypothetical protein
MEILDDIFDVRSFFIELGINDSDRLVRHLFYGAIVSITMRALFDFLALLNNIFENRTFLLGV